MKAKGMSLLCLALALGPAASEMDFDEERNLPQFAAGGKRLEILSRLRNDLVAAAKENRLAAMDSLLREGDGEFGRRIWLSNEERLYLCLVLGRGKGIVQEARLRGIFWGGIGSYYEGAFPRLCFRESGPGYPGAFRLDFAPDLIDHLKDRFDRDRESILGRLKSQADLFDLLSIARCPDRVREGTDKLTRHDIRVLEAYVRKHPDSRLSEEILHRAGFGRSWTGNGWLIGGGPAFSWHDEETGSLLDEGIQGSFFSDMNYRLLKAGIDIQIRPFTPRRPFAFDDTVVSAGQARFRRIILHAGHSFRLARNVFLTPFTGLIFSELSLAQADEERLRKMDKSESSVGFPVGANLDWLYIFPGQAGEEFIAGLGLRLTCAWHRGNWTEMESGLGDDGAVAGLKVFFALAGTRRD